MSGLPRVSGRVCLKVLPKVGFVMKRQHGSHMILRQDKQFAQVVAPDHEELDRGMLRVIIRQTDLTVKQFIGLL